MSAVASRLMRSVAARRVGVMGSRQFAALACPMGFGGGAAPEPAPTNDSEPSFPQYPKVPRPSSEISGSPHPLKAILTFNTSFVDGRGKKRSILDPTSNVHLFRYLYREHAKGDNMSVFPIPGLGDLYVVHDPAEFLKVIRKEGQYPHGGIAASWPMKSYFSREESKITGLLGSNHEWKKFRMIIQKDLLSPKTARGYVPAIARACQISSDHLEVNADQVDTWSARASFDIFCSVFFGKFFNACAMDETSHPSGLAICEGMEQVGEVAFKMMVNPFEAIADKMNLMTPQSKRFAAGFRRAQVNATALVEEFMEREAKGELDEYEEKSYLYGMVQRQKVGDVSISETVELCTVLLSAAVDTTSAVLNWNLLHLALNPDVQEKLCEELKEVLGGGDLTEELVSSGKGWLPYLHAVVRETHRMNPAFATSIIRQIDSEIDICGFHFEKDNWFTLDAFSVQNEPTLVEDCDEFKPERWFPEAVAERKGTPSEIIDHPLIRAPFSAGARMCPGSRVANLEIMGLLARVVQDYHIEVVGVSHISDVEGFQGGTIQPKPMPKFKLRRRTD